MMVLIFVGMVAWLRLLADAGCLTDEQQVKAEQALHEYTVSVQNALHTTGYYSGPVDGVYGPETADAVKKSFLATLPDSVSLENFAYRVNIIGFILWTFTLMAGAIWAEKAWGRYWGWDTKEVWTFIIWVIYAGYIHAWATRNEQMAEGVLAGLRMMGCNLCLSYYSSLVAENMADRGALV